MQTESNNRFKLSLIPRCRKIANYTLEKLARLTKGSIASLKKHFQKIKNIFKTLAWIGGLGSLVSFALSSQRNTDADIATAWQLLAQEKVGNFGRAYAANLLTTSHCIIRNNVYDMISSSESDESVSVNPCYIPSFGWFRGPHSLSGIDLSSDGPVRNVLDGLNLAHVSLNGSNLTRVAFRRAAIIDSDLSSTIMRNSFFQSSKINNNVFDQANFDCVSIFGSDFLQNFVSSVNFRSSIILMSKMSFERRVQIETIQTGDVKIVRQISMNVDFSDAQIINSRLSFSQSKGLFFNNSVIRFSNINLDHVDFASFENADLTSSTLTGGYSNRAFSKHIIFDNTNLSAADLSGLANIEYDALSKSFYCNEDKPTLPSDYRGFPPTSVQCESKANAFLGAIKTLKNIGYELNDDKVSRFAYRVRTKRENDYCIKVPEDKFSKEEGEIDLTILTDRIFLKSVKTNTKNIVIFDTPFVANKKIGTELNIRRAFNLSQDVDRIDWR